MEKHDYYFYKILEGGMATPTPEDCIVKSKIKITEKGIYEDVKDYFENDSQKSICKIMQIGDIVHISTSTKGYGNRSVFVMKYFKYHDGLSDQKIHRVK